VVLLHGSGPGATGWANFSRNIDPLVEAGYRVILLDCPGWGKSDSIVNRGSRSDLNARVLKSVISWISAKCICWATRWADTARWPF
jgi:2-hydroxy-6-oxonona-2,4-dienedioate hydrolase